MLRRRWWRRRRLSLLLLLLLQALVLVVLALPPASPTATDVFPSSSSYSNSSTSISSHLPPAGHGSSRRRRHQHQHVQQDGRRSARIPDEQKLLEALLANYHMYSRPVFNASDKVVIKFGLTLVQISDMDEVNQVLTINVWLEQEWQDERLVWDPKDYNGLEILRIPCEKIWLPDIVLYNSADDFTTGYMKSKAMVSSTGNVFWPPPAKFRSSCKIDITYFPFDDQVCELKFGSWTYDGFQVDITNRSAQIDLTNYVFSGEWELVDIRIKRTEMYYACCQEPYPDVRFTIIIRRKTLYYLFNIIFPCLWLTILSLLGFWLPPDSGEKITLGITVLLAFSVFMLLIAESMPATSEFVPLIGIYLTVTMAMTSLSIILTVFVLQLHHVGPHQKRVPRWLWSLAVDVLAPLVCLCHIQQRYRHLGARTSRPPHPTSLLGRSATSSSSRQDDIGLSTLGAGTDMEEGGGPPRREDGVRGNNCNGLIQRGSGRGPGGRSRTDEAGPVTRLRKERLGGLGPTESGSGAADDWLSGDWKSSEGKSAGVGKRSCRQESSDAPPTSSIDAPHAGVHEAARGSEGARGRVAGGSGGNLSWRSSGGGTPARRDPLWRPGEHLLPSSAAGGNATSSRISIRALDALNIENCTVVTLAPDSQDALPSPNIFRHSNPEPARCVTSPQQQSVVSSAAGNHLEVRVRCRRQDEDSEGPWRLGRLEDKLQNEADPSVPHTASMDRIRGHAPPGYSPTEQPCILSSSSASRATSSSQRRVGARPGAQDYQSEQISQHVQVLLSRDEEDDYHRDVVTEWRVVAHVMDRLLFWLFLIVAIVSSVIILIVKPLTKPEPWRVDDGTSAMPKS